MSTQTDSIIFENNGQKLVWGDALQVLDGAVADASVDLIFADPPYNIGKSFNGRRDKWPSDEAYLEWSYQWIEVCLRKPKRKLKKTRKQVLPLKLIRNEKWNSNPVF